MARLKVLFCLRAAPMAGVSSQCHLFSGPPDNCLVKYFSFYFSSKVPMDPVHIFASV